MSDGHLATDTVDHEWLGVLDRARSGGGIARVPERTGSLEMRELVLAEDLRDKAHVFVHDKGGARTVARDNARTFLAAMLQGEKTVIGQDRGIGMAEDAEQAALMLRKRLPLGRLKIVIDLFWRDHRE